MNNGYEVCEEITKIFISRYDGTVFTALIDTEDLAIVSEFNGTWCLSHEKKNDRFYARGNIIFGGTRTTISMHRWIMKPPHGFVVDHINHNGLDNRRSRNLRTVSSSDNQMNRKSKSSRNSSGYKNVYWRVDRKQWQAAFKHSGKLFHFGFYDDPSEAFRAVSLGRSEYEKKYSKKYIGITDSRPRFTG